MYSVSLTSGPAEIIANGSVISYLNNSINMTISLPGFDLVIIFKFEDEEGIDEPTSHPSVTEKGELIVLLKNYKSSLGIGLTRPLQIGMYENNALFLNFRVYSLTDNSDKLIHYTVYRDRGELIKK